MGFSTEADRNGSKLRSGEFEGIEDTEVGRAIQHEPEHTLTLVLRIKTSTTTDAQRLKLCQRILRILTVKLGADRVFLYEAVASTESPPAVYAGNPIADPRGDT